MNKNYKTEFLVDENVSSYEFYSNLNRSSISAFGSPLDKLKTKKITKGTF